MPEQDNRLEILYKYPPNVLIGYIRPRKTFMAYINLEERNMAIPTIILYQGNNDTYRFSVREYNPDVDLYDSEILDLTGATCLFEVKDKPDGTTIFTKSTANPSEGLISDPSGGECEFYIVPGDSNIIDVRQYDFYLKVELSNGKLYTAFYGKLNLKYS